MRVMKSIRAILISFLLVSSPMQALGSNYTMIIECNPQFVDINSSCDICITLFKGESQYVIGQDIFLGLDGIKGRFDEDKITTDSSGTANTKFYPEDIGQGNIIAKTNILDGSSVISISSESFVSIEKRDRLPVSVIESVMPNPAKTGEKISFHGSGTDPEGSVVAWIWDMGDGSTLEGTGNESTIEYAYSESGVYRVTLRFKDESEKWSEPAWVTITVIGINAPTIKTSNTWPKLTVSHRELEFQVEINDADGNLDNCTFDWGDGEFKEIALSGSNAQLKETHTYKKTGIFTIRVTATDETGLSTVFPENGWLINVYDKARGGIRISIPDHQGKKICLIGPLPQRTASTTVTMEDWGFRVYEKLLPGRYYIVSEDKTHAFIPIDNRHILVQPFEILEYECRQWTPEVSARLMIEKNSAPILQVRVTELDELVDEPVQINVTGDGETIYSCSGNNGSFNIPYISNKHSTLHICFNAGGVHGGDVLDVQITLPHIDLAVSPYSSDSLLLKINAVNIDRVELSGSATNFITRETVPIDRVINAQSNLKPGQTPIRIVDPNCYKYIISLTATYSTDDMLVLDTINFVPYMRHYKLDVHMGYNDDKLQINGGLVEPDEICLSRNQRYLIQAKCEDDMISPIDILHTPDGYINYNLSIDQVLDSLHTNKTDIVVSTVSGGITFSESFTIRRIGRKPTLECAFDGMGFTLELKDKESAPVPGIWIDLEYLINGLPANEKALKDIGNPSESVRASHTGKARVECKPQAVDGLSIITSVNIEGYELLKVFKPTF